MAHRHSPFHRAHLHHIYLPVHGWHNYPPVYGWHDSLPVYILHNYPPVYNGYPGVRNGKRICGMPSRPHANEHVNDPCASCLTIEILCGCLRVPSCACMCDLCFVHNLAPRMTSTHPVPQLQRPQQVLLIRGASAGKQPDSGHWNVYKSLPARRRQRGEQHAAVKQRAM